MHAHPEFLAAVTRQILGLLALAGALGWLMRLRGLPALGWGAHALFSACYFSYEICFGFGISLGWFPLLAAGLLAGGVMLLRRHRPAPPAAGARMDWVNLTATAALAFPIVWIRTLNGFSPNASAQFFQAWDPLFLQASLGQGRYLAVKSMSLGEGFLTSALQYAPNTRGLSTLLGLAGSSNLYASYVAAGSFALIAGLGMLVDALKPSRAATGLFIFLFLVFAMGYQPLTNHILGASSDEMLFFAAALAAHALFAETGWAQPEKWAVAFAALAVGICGRNYGGFFALALLGPFLITVWRRPGGIRAAVPFLAFGTLLVTPEVVRLCTAASIFYPRVRLPDLFPWSLERFGWGSLCDWGLLYERMAGHYAPSVLGIYAVILALVGAHLARWRRLDLLPPVIAPLLFLLLPLLLELVSGFRKDVAYSKIYFGSSWIFAWLPAYALLRLGAAPPLTGRLRPILAARLLAVATVLGVGGLFLQGYGEGYYRFLGATEFHAKTVRWWNAESSGIDESVARKALARPGPAGAERFAGRRIMYFHYEPGIGLRWYLGGEFFNDLDFWSRPVQDRLAPDAGVAELLEKFNRPLLYLSLGPRPLYQPYVSYPPRPRLWRDLENWRDLDVFSEVIEQDGALLMIPR